MGFFKKIFSCFQVSRDPNGQQSKKPPHRPRNTGRNTPFPGQLSSFGMTSAIDDIPSRLPNTSFEVDSGNADSGQVLTSEEIDLGYESDDESGGAIGEHADVHSGSRETLTKSWSDVCCSAAAEASDAELRRRALAIESLSVKTWGDIGNISGAESSSIAGLRGVLAEQAGVGLGKHEFETDSLRFKNWDYESSDSGINTTPPQGDQEGVLYSRAWARIVGPRQQEGRLTANITPHQDQDEIEEDVTEPT